MDIESFKTKFQTELANKIPFGFSNAGIDTFDLAYFGLELRMPDVNAALYLPEDILVGGTPETLQTSKDSKDADNELTSTVKLLSSDGFQIVTHIVNGDGAVPTVRMIVGEYGRNGCVDMFLFIDRDINSNTMVVSVRANGRKGTMMFSLGGASRLVSGDIVTAIEVALASKAAPKEMTLYWIASDRAVFRQPKSLSLQLVDLTINPKGGQHWCHFKSGGQHYRYRTDCASVQRRKGFMADNV